jgi:hypothetical protein
MEKPERRGLDPSQVPHIFGVPRHLYRKAFASIGRWAKAVLRHDIIGAFENELWLWFFAGIVVERWKNWRRHRTAALGQQRRSTI